MVNNSDDVMMMSYFLGLANEAVVVAAWFWRLSIPTYWTSVCMGMGHGDWIYQNGTRSV